MILNNYRSADRQNPVHGPGWLNCQSQLNNLSKVFRSGCHSWLEKDWAVNSMVSVGYFFVLYFLPFLWVLTALNQPLHLQQHLLYFLGTEHLNYTWTTLIQCVMCFVVMTCGAWYLIWFEMVFLYEKLFIGSTVYNCTHRLKISVTSPLFIQKR